MKDDREEYCRARLDELLAARGFSSGNWETPEQDPPDRYLTLHGYKFAVEFTSTRHETLAVDGGRVQSEGYENLIVQFTKEFESRARATGILHGSYLLSFFKPFATEDYRAHRNALLDLMLRGLAQLQDAPAGYRWEPNPGRYMDTMRLWKVDRNGSMVTWSAAGCNVSADAQSDGRNLLEAAIQEKLRKLAKRAVIEPVILVILNTFDWLTGPDYQTLSNDIADLMRYEAVFVIDRHTGLCTELTTSLLLRSVVSSETHNQNAECS